MLLINSITSDSKQKMTIPLDNGDSVDFYIYFSPSQYSWYFDFTYNEYTSNGNKVVITPNALRHLRNIIPFGIAFITDSQVEPFDITDFETGRVKMYVLDSDDVNYIEETIYNVE